jgi:AAA family ATP:ADP antiporter
LAGAALLLCTVVLGLSVRQLSLVVMAMLAVWITLVVLIRKQYVDAFRSALSRREIDPSQLTVNITDAATVETLRESLRSSNEREVGYALKLLSAADDQTLLEELGELLRHSSSEIKLNALQLISRLDPDGEVANISDLMRDEEPEVRLAALRFVARREGFDRVARLIRENGFKDDLRILASEIRLRAESLRRIDPGAVNALIEQSRELPSGRAVRLDLARAIGGLGESGAVSEVRGVIDTLLEDDDPGVADETILSIGKTRDRHYVPVLIHLLNDSRRRRFARDAFVEFGDGVVGTLGDVLADERSDVAIRSYIPVVLGRIPTQKSVDALAANLTAADSLIRFRVVKALNKLRNGYPDLKIKDDAIDAAFVEETKIYYEILQISSMQKSTGQSDADALLSRALDERLTLNLERIFRLLGLSYPAKDIYNAYLGIVSPFKDRHASAVEFLDNVVGKNVKKYLFPIIDRISERAAVERGQELFGLEVKTRDEALLKLIAGPDSWLRTCAIFCVTETASDEVKRSAKNALRDPDPMVVETTELVLPRLG